MDVRSIEEVAPVVEHNGTVPVWWLVSPREMQEITAGGHLELRPFVEGSVAHVGVVEGIVDPEQFYGSDVLPSLSVGVRMDWGGMNKMRMGRYGTGGESVGQDHSEHMGHQ